LFCYGPETVHEIESDPARPMTKFFVDFFGREAATLLRGAKLRPGSAVQSLEIDSLRLLFEQLIAEGNVKRPSSAAICAAYLRIVLLKTADAVKPSENRAVSSGTLFHRCRDFIDAHYPKLMTLDDLTRELHIRPSYLCRLFKQFGQPSPFQYLIQKKMNRAAQFLVGEQWTVKQTALELGYKDPYHFSRVFKRHFGHSPVNFVSLSWRTQQGRRPALR
jgi:AraC-like DNA-binding protein